MFGMFAREDPSLTYLFRYELYPFVKEEMNDLGEKGFPVWEASIAIPQGRSEIDRLVDIDGDPGLARKYDITVPVLLHPGSGRELFFPFDDETLAHFLVNV